MKTIKVDRVSSVEEVKKLQGLGVNAIGVSLSVDRVFRDNRILSKKEALLIKKKIEKDTVFVGYLSGENYQKTIELAVNIGFDYIQLSSSQILPDEVYEELKAQKIGLIYCSLECSYDSDPSWILGDLHNVKFDFAQIDLLPDVIDSWKFLKEKCPDFPDELQVSDINAIAANKPLLITTDLSAQNTGEIFDSLSNIKGVAFVLGENPTRNDFHYFSYYEVIEILEPITFQGLSC